MIDYFTSGTVVVNFNYSFGKNMANWDIAEKTQNNFLDSTSEDTRELKRYIYKTNLPFLASFSLLFPPRKCHLKVHRSLHSLFWSRVPVLHNYIYIEYFA